MIRGFVSPDARLTGNLYRYLAVYEGDGNPRKMIDGLGAALQAGMYISPAMDPVRTRTVFIPVMAGETDRSTAGLVRRGGRAVAHDQPSALEVACSQSCSFVGVVGAGR